MRPIRSGAEEEEVSPLRSVMKQYMKIMKLHHCILDCRVRKTGVYRSQHQILMMLARHSNISQKEIAQHLYVSTATIAVSVKKLEKGGYITRVVDQDDNRMNKLGLTEMGWDMVKCSQEYFHTVETQMFTGFTKEELSEMEQMLDRIYTNLSQIPMGENMTEREE
ncbi:MarR family transcriptional regulator [Clostridium sp. E02]|uniref:MarR family winged helix-turn-helix transcriptional regulator n=1 Tax=Clostridium sp. E02 TaxID=2487134 RepID=UPI000F542D89|nr:MarR family transcriptional regulator [Clostridium sp. E02]